MDMPIPPIITHLNTANIIQNKIRARSLIMRVALKVPFKHSPSYIVLSAGTLLLFCGFRQAVASISLLPTTDVLDQIELLEPVGPDSLRALITDQRFSLSVLDDPATASGLGLALSLQATAGRSVDADGVDEAKHLLMHSVALAPANPYVWTRLALLSSSPEETLRYWRLSKATGPNEIRLRLIRVKLALPIWQIMTKRDHEDVFDDVFYAWPSLTNDDDLKFVNMAAEDPLARAIIRSALLRDLARLADFEKRLAMKLR
jgi:hypothetical protein